MNPIFIDTNAYVAFKRGDVEALKILQNAPLIAVSAVVLGELYSGFAFGNKEENNRAELADFLALPHVSVIDVSHAIAQRYATVYRKLRKAGTPIPTNDMWIAAAALENGFDLFSFDQHFDKVDGLSSGRTLTALEQ